MKILLDEVFLHTGYTVVPKDLLQQYLQNHRPFMKYFSLLLPNLLQLTRKFPAITKIMEESKETQSGENQCFRKEETLVQAAEILNNHREGLGVQSFFSNLPMLLENQCMRNETCLQRIKSSGGSIEKNITMKVSVLKSKGTASREVM